MEENPPVNDGNLPEESSEENSFSTDDPSADYEGPSENLVRLSTSA
jgi:hypothetical protein